MSAAPSVRTRRSNTAAPRIAPKYPKTTPLAPTCRPDPPSSQVAPPPITIVMVVIHAQYRMPRTATSPPRARNGTVFDARWPKSVCRNGAHMIPSSPSTLRGRRPWRWRRSSRATVSTSSIAHISRIQLTSSPTGVHTSRANEGRDSVGEVIASCYDSSGAGFRRTPPRNVESFNIEILRPAGTLAGA